VLETQTHLLLLYKISTIAITFLKYTAYYSINILARSTRMFLVLLQKGGLLLYIFEAHRQLKYGILLNNLSFPNFKFVFKITL